MGALIHLVWLLLLAVVWGTNRAAKRERERANSARRPMAVPDRRQAGENSMEQNDVDQFLDEVLGRRGAAQQRPKPPAQQQAEPVVLRPGAASTPQQRARAPQRRPQRPAAQRPAPAGRPAAKPAPPAAPGELMNMGLVKQAMNKAAASTTQAASDADQAASAAGGAASLRSVSAQATARQQQAAMGDIRALLSSPAEIRRAILIREILGPPVALRRRKM